MISPQTLAARLWRSLSARLPRWHPKQKQGQPAGQPPAHWAGQTRPSGLPVHWLEQIQHFTPYPLESAPPLPVDDKLEETPERPAHGVDKKPSPATPIHQPAQIPHRPFQAPAPLSFARVQFSSVKAGQQAEMAPPSPPKPQTVPATHKPQGKPDASLASSPAAWPSGRKQTYENPWPEHGRQIGPFAKPLSSSAKKQAPEHPMTAENDHWPTLPNTPSTPADVTHVLRVWRHHQRLDQEQRGSGWNG